MISNKKKSHRTDKAYCKIVGKIRYLSFEREMEREEESRRKRERNTRNPFEPMELMLLYIHIHTHVRINVETIYSTGFLTRLTCFKYL